MRIARVLHESSPQPLVALERDGAIYDVSELEQSYGSRFATDDVRGASDFHARVVALGCAGMRELDDRLRSGRRPSSARLLPGTFLWRAPCATERAARVHVDIVGAPAAHSRVHRLEPAEPAQVDRMETEPQIVFAPARSLEGHESILAWPRRESGDSLQVTLDLAVMLGEDLHRADIDDAHRAILGYSILAVASPLGAIRDAAFALTSSSALGPLLVTTDELPRFERARAVASTEQRKVEGTCPSSIDVATALACVSRDLELCAGDVVGIGPVVTIVAGRAATVRLAIEQLGRLTLRTAPE